MRIYAYEPGRMIQAYSAAKIRALIAEQKAAR